MRDPGGAVVALAKPLARGGGGGGASVSAASVGWHLLHTADVERAKANYADLFGWSSSSRWTSEASGCSTPSRGKPAARPSARCPTSARDRASTRTGSFTCACRRSSPPSMRYALAGAWSSPRSRPPVGIGSRSATIHRALRLRSSNKPPREPRRAQGPAALRSSAKACVEERRASRRVDARPAAIAFVEAIAP